MTSGGNEVHGRLEIEIDSIFLKSEVIICIIEIICTRSSTHLWHNTFSLESLHKARHTDFLLR